MADSRQQRPHDESDRDNGVYIPQPREPEPSSPWAPPPPTLPPEQTWQPEEVLSGEIEQGPFVQETDIYGNPVPGHYRNDARYADADAAVDNDHFSAGRTVWSQPQPNWAPEQPAPPSAEPPPPSASSTRPTLSSSFRPRGPVAPPPSTSGFIPAQRTAEPTWQPPARDDSTRQPPAPPAEPTWQPPTPPAEPTWQPPTPPQQSPAPGGFAPQQPSAPGGYGPQQSPAQPHPLPPEPPPQPHYVPPQPQPLPPQFHQPPPPSQPLPPPPLLRGTSGQNGPGDHYFPEVVANNAPPVAPQAPPAGYVPQPPPVASQQAPSAGHVQQPPQQAPVGDYGAQQAPPAGYGQPPPVAPQPAPPAGYAPPPQQGATGAGAPLAQQSTLSQQFSRRTSATPYVAAAAEAGATAAAPAPPIPTSAPPRIAPPPPKKSSASGRRWWVAIGATILAAAIAAGALVGLNLASRSENSENKQPASLAGASCGGKPVLTVAVAPEFASIVEKAAAAIKGAGDGCTPVKVAKQEPATTLGQLANNPPDAWIPPSTAWLRMSGPRKASAPGSSGSQNPSGPQGSNQPQSPSAEDPSAVGPSAAPTQTPSNGLFAPNAVSLARSPVIVAAPKAFADASGWPDKQLGWTQLTAGVINHQIPKFSMGNPLRDTASLLAVLGVQVAMAGTTKDPGIAQMRALTLRARLADADDDSTALLKKAAGLSNPATAVQDLGLFPVTEQELWQYSRDNPKIQLAGIYPADTLMEADYPLALTTKTAADQARRDIATQLADAITARTFISNLTDAGFRPAAQTAASAGAGVALAPNATGLLAQYARAIPLPPAIAEPAAIWARYKQLAFQTLILVDGSGSMNDPVKLRDGTQSTKADLLRLAGSQAAQLYGEETSLAMWLFASPPQTPNAPPFSVAVPFGPVNDKINGVPRRDIMRAAAAGYKAIPTAGTPLYETVLRGVEDMKKRQKPNTVTMVVVLTDGRDEDSPYAMSQQQFLQRLGAVEDRAHPVPVFAIGYGANADMNGLGQMAKLTGGQAVASNDPGDLASAVAKIFLAAHLR
jgi:Ca-activated chloride channel family protein